MFRLVSLEPLIQVKTIKTNTLLSDWNFCQVRAHLAIEAVYVDPEITRAIAQSDQSRHDFHCLNQLPSLIGLS